MSQSKLQKLIEDWIRAEFHFRFGTYGGIDPLDAQKLYVQAEKRLRKVVTGKSELINAGKVLGLKIENSRFPGTRKKKNRRLK